MDLWRSPWLFPLIHFTCESVLNDEHLENYWLYRKVLWMSLSQLLKIFIVVHMFDWRKARNFELLCVKQQYCLFWSHLSGECPLNTTNGLEGSFSSSDQIDQEHVKDLKKLSRRHGKDEVWKQQFHVCLVVCKRTFHGNFFGFVKVFWIGAHFDHTLATRPNLWFMFPYWCVYLTKVFHLSFSTNI